MHHSKWKEGLQAWGWVEADVPGKVHCPSFNFANKEQALNGLREGWALAKIQYHNDKWEVVRIYEDPPRKRAQVDPWKKHSVHSRGMWLESIAP